MSSVLSSHKNVLIGIAGFLVFVIGIGGYLYYQNNPEMKTQSGEVVVEINSDGFKPDTLRVKLGTTVIFKNTDDIGHWPASDLHPSHSLYPEFDPKRMLKGGEEWSHTFDKVGQWGMHDHLSPYLEGTITVVE